jgi:hypothetical protein
MSSSRLFSSIHGVISSRMPDSSLWSACALSASSQKSGAADCSSRRATFCCLAAKSKTLQEVRDVGAQVGDRVTTLLHDFLSYR